MLSFIGELKLIFLGFVRIVELRSMRKFVVTAALLILIFGAVCFMISETRFEKELIDDWNPIHPSTLYPKYYNETMPNYTGSFFIDRAYGRNELFRQLMKQRKIFKVSLEVCVNASGNVSVKVGKLMYPFFNTSTPTYDPYFSDIFFSTTGSFINETVEVDITEIVEIIAAGRAYPSQYWLDIRNSEGDRVDIYLGYVRLWGEVPKTFHPFYGVGSLIFLLGFSLMIYGVLRSKRQNRRKS